MRHAIKWLLAFPLLLAVLLGSTYTITNTFSSGTTAVASQVNANFSAAKTAIDDNHTRLATVEALFTGSDANTALALAANGSNCSAGSYPLGVTAAGAVESCTDATTEIDAVVATKSAATSTDNAVARFDSTAGDVQNSGVLISDTNDLTVPGDITSGTSGATCLILRDSDDAGNSACEVLNGTLSCEVDTNDTCGDAT